MLLHQVKLVHESNNKLEVNKLLKLGWVLLNVGIVGDSEYQIIQYTLGWTLPGDPKF